MTRAAGPKCRAHYASAGAAGCACAAGCSRLNQSAGGTRRQRRGRKAWGALLASVSTSRAGYSAGLWGEHEGPDQAQGGTGVGLVCHGCGGTERGRGRGLGNGMARVGPGVPAQPKDSRQSPVTPELSGGAWARTCSHGCPTALPRPCSPPSQPDWLGPRTGFFLSNFQDSVSAETLPSVTGNWLFACPWLHVARAPHPTLPALEAATQNCNPPQQGRLGDDPTHEAQGSQAGHWQEVGRVCQT